ncbi:MAG: hypothetical protein LBS01_07945 [Prevotellaceae bacterium]|jgi:hypothetical protein|nr:hypothetical protein [Prevotellaceae bacterium]
MAKETVFYKAKSTAGLIKKYHVLCGQQGIDAEQREFLLVSNYGVTSSKDLNYSHLLELVQLLERNGATPERSEMDVWRKRLMGAIGGWLRSIGRAADGNAIKAIACRAAKVKNFNKIPLEQLRGLYNAFNNYKKDMKSVNELTMEFLTINN